MYTTPTPSSGSTGTKRKLDPSSPDQDPSALADAARPGHPSDRENISTPPSKRQATSSGFIGLLQTFASPVFKLLTPSKPRTQTPASSVSSRSDGASSPPTTSSSPVEPAPKLMSLHRLPPSARPVPERSVFGKPQDESIADEVESLLNQHGPLKRKTEESDPLPKPAESSAAVPSTRPNFDGLASTPSFSSKFTFTFAPHPSKSEAEPLANVLSDLTREHVGSPPKRTNELLASFFSRKGDQKLTNDEAKKIIGILQTQAEPSKVIFGSSITSVPSATAPLSSSSARKAILTPGKPSRFASATAKPPTKAIFRTNSSRPFGLGIGSLNSVPTSVPAPLTPSTSTSSEKKALSAVLQSGKRSKVSDPVEGAGDIKPAPAILESLSDQIAPPKLTTAPRSATAKKLLEILDSSDAPAQPMKPLASVTRKESMLKTNSKKIVAKVMSSIDLDGDIEKIKQAVTESSELWKKPSDTPKKLQPVFSFPSPAVEKKSVQPVVLVTETAPLPSSSAAESATFRASEASKTLASFNREAKASEPSSVKPSLPAFSFSTPTASFSFGQPPPSQSDFPATAKSDVSSISSAPKADVPASSILARLGPAPIASAPLPAPQSQSQTVEESLSKVSSLSHAQLPLFSFRAVFPSALRFADKSIRESAAQAPRESLQTFIFDKVSSSPIAVSAATSASSGGFDWSKAGMKKPEAEAGSWKCKTCDCSNKEDATKCISCEEPNPSKKAAAPTFGFGAASVSSAPTTAPSGGFDWSKAGMKKPEAEAGSWKCKTCDCSNKEDATKCISCEEPNPSKKAAAPTFGFGAASVSSAPTTAPSGGFDWSKAGMKKPEAEAGSWKCKTCDCSNKEDATKCISCEEPNPSKKAAAPTFGFGAPSTMSAATSAPSGGFDWSKAGMKKPEAEAGSWKCKTCDCSNKEDATKCISCEEPNPSKKTAAPAFGSGAANSSTGFSFGAPSGGFTFGSGSSGAGGFQFGSAGGFAFGSTDTASSGTTFGFGVPKTD
ncbi:uncharacterized protein BJ171DRAFT_456471 [Polychytrium aggregatum]|uniref:uncharacterized protein n=1 Tax=Polychytrium aggregatum TaxID=110093 RepID=UPI0022FF10CF|nr:uncharacterized protein BJ171DRAFT_456471 [Polychytrium aggregatum]KAI9207238.1 hypothetical protein BJ171DRAFT_456471 [Polychytrium aggregatum]